MKKAGGELVLAHVLLALLAALVLAAPKQRAAVRDPGAMLACLALIEGAFLVQLRRKDPRSCCDMILLVWLLLIVWELGTSVLDLAHPVLVPCPENVFDTFREQWRQMLLNAAWSVELLAAGFFIGMALAVGLGLTAGWFPRLGALAYPIANVMAPIPPVVISPYLVALMPSFRSASLMVVLLGIFWPNFLGVINRVRQTDPRILDSARMLGLNSGDMILRILLPSILPGLISGLKVSVTTALLMLNFAELMGASHGMGYYIQNSITYANYTHAVAGILCVGLTVTLLSRLMEAVQKHAVPWRREVRGSRERKGRSAMRMPKNLLWGGAAANQGEGAWEFRARWMNEDEAAKASLAKMEDMTDEEQDEVE